MTPENYTKRDSGLIFRDYEVGKGDCPKAGQQVFLSCVPFKLPPNLKSNSINGDYY